MERFSRAVPSGKTTALHRSFATSARSKEHGKEHGAKRAGKEAANAEVKRCHEVNRGLQTTSLPGNVHVQEDSENAASADGDRRFKLQVLSW